MNIKIASILNKIPKWATYTLVYFTLSRIVLTVIGLVTMKITAGLPSFPSAVVNHTQYNWLNLWGHWDSGWYMRIASLRYHSDKIQTVGSVGQADYAFFPLYPEIMKFLGKIIGNNFTAGFVISNLALLFCCYFIYKISRLENDEGTALRSIKYLIFFPTAFLFSSVLTESTFLAFTLACYYFAKKKNWLLAGILGGLSSMTKSVGVFIIIPCLLEFYKSYKKNGWGNFSVLFLILIPIGLAVFSLFNFHLTGDLFAFTHVQSAWGRSIGNPFYYLLKGLLSRNGYYDFINAFVAMIGLLSVAVFYKKFSSSEIIICLYSILIPLSTGLTSMPRYILVAFPLILLSAKLSKKKLIDDSLSYSFVLLQGFMMVFWVLGTYLTM